MDPKSDLWSSRTPEKLAQPARRAITRQQTLRSVKQVREAAKQLWKMEPQCSDASDWLTTTKVQNTKPKISKPLPEKYEILLKFFHSLGSSIRLLRLKGSMSTFTNISRQVEILTDRTFGYGHLAQLKFILPEAIETKKILIRDDRTCCMKPDLHITLNFAIVQNDENEKLTSGSANLLLNKLFRSRLLRFCKSNPKGDDVPEEELSEPFNQSRKLTFSNANQKPDLDSVQNVTDTIYEQQPIAASHMPQSFKRHFSKQALSHNVVLTSETRVDHDSTKSVSPSKCSENVQTPIKRKEDLYCTDATPVKPISTPFCATPAQSTPPVRYSMTPDEEESTMSPSKLTRRKSGKRSITFDTPIKNKTPPVKRVSTDEDDDDLSDILSCDLLASIKEKELKALEEKNPEISQAKFRKQMIARLPKLFDTLLFYFHSKNRTVVTKQELVKMIISNQLEIVDPKEVDEQLRLLQELAPEWIHEKIASSGDFLFCVNKISSTESIRARLSEAN